MRKLDGAAAAHQVGHRQIVAFFRSQRQLQVGDLHAGFSQT